MPTKILTPGFVGVLTQTFKPSPYGPKTQSLHQTLVRGVTPLLELHGSMGNLSGHWRIPRDWIQELLTQEYNAYYRSRHRRTHKAIREFLAQVFQGYGQVTLGFQHHRQVYLVRP